MKEQYTLKVEYNENSDEYYIILPKEFLDKAGWKEGDKIKWTKKKDTYILTKVK